MHRQEALELGMQCFCIYLFELSGIFAWTRGSEFIYALLKLET
jgi:hypothetical protein